MQRSTFSPRPVLLACAFFGALACDREVHLGALGDASGSDVLWRATFEPGDLSEWISDGQGGMYVDNATVVPAATRTVAHRGQYAGISTFAPAGGMPSLCYLHRQQPSPPEAYYSAWFFIPANVDVQGWLSLHHFRGSPTGDGRNLVALWDLNLIPGPGGTVIAHLYDYRTGLNFEQAPPAIPVPLATWVHFEVFLRKATDATGRVAVWQDGVPIVDASNVITTRSDWIQWDAGGASNDVLPVPSVVYIDDAAISLSRVGIE